MSSLIRKEKKLSINACLQREINYGCTLEEAYIPPKNLVDINTRTLTKKIRLL
jgi:hypothetical protein